MRSQLCNVSWLSAVVQSAILARVTRSAVLEVLRSGQARIIDARSVEEYTGAKALSERGGHIPSACRLEWSDLVDEDGRFREPGGL